MDMPDDCTTCVNANSDRCALCVNRSKYRRRRSRAHLETKSKRKGAELERIARDVYNKARLQANSGAHWSQPLDVSLPGLLVEAKDRGYITAKGRKSFTVSKDDLDKAERQAGVTPCTLMFRFKDDDGLYAVIRYETLCRLIAELDCYRDPAGRA